MKNERFALADKVFNNLNIEILDHGHLYADRSWRYHNITSPFNRLYFIINGEGYIENATQKITLEPGRMYLIPSQSTNTYICDNSLEKFYIHFRTELLSGRDIFELADSCSSLPYDIVSLDKVIKSLKEETLTAIFMLKSFLYDALGKCLPLIWDGLQSQLEILYKYRNVYKLIRESHSWKLTPEDIAEQICIPYADLLKDFKKDTGSSLKICINSMVLQWAKEKILLTDMSLKEIAFSLDFDDQFYFSRFFKKHTGLSPKEYRIRNISMIPNNHNSQ